MHIKITRALYDRARQDLARRHAYATERIGFFLGKVGTVHGKPELNIVTEYVVVDDDDYERNDMVGASIGSNAIRKVMQRILDTGCGALHVHAHQFPGTPGLSRTDRRSIPALIGSFQNLNPAQPHGIFLFSEDGHKAWVLPPASDASEVVEKITVVGYPLSITYYV